jgi:hypothetical protein
LATYIAKKFHFNPPLVSPNELHGTLTQKPKIYGKWQFMSEKTAKYLHFIYLVSPNELHGIPHSLSPIIYGK